MTCNPDYKNATWAYYRFEPSVPVNAIFVVLFALSTLLHCFQLFKTKTWYLIALTLAGACEAIGYVGRVMGANQDPGCWTMGPYIMQSILILIAPALMAASIYMILGRIILLTDSEHLSLVRRKWLTKIFVTGDVISFFAQGGGGGMMASASMNKTGEKVIVVGLFIQLLFFGAFISVAGVLHSRLSKNPTPRSQSSEVRWKHYLTTLYVTGALILVRSIFRVIEFIQGNHGALMKSEVYVFVFDGLLMITVMAWMNWFHPSEIGLLLRGDEPIKNGLELVKPGRGSRSRSRTMESLSSSTAV